MDRYWLEDLAREVQRLKNIHASAVDHSRFEAICSIRTRILAAAAESIERLRFLVLDAEIASTKLVPPADAEPEMGPLDGRW